MKCDFEGYVTKNDVRCMDGRIIRKDAFKENDKMSVPLVWQHRHDSPENVLGHIELENREDGVYGYGFFNNTDMAKTAKELVANKDIRNMSIYANHLVEKDNNVTHGSIKEVSLVITGANPGAVINHVAIAHSDGFVTEIEDECDIFTDEEILYHFDKDNKEDKKAKENEEEKEKENEEENEEEKEKEKENEEENKIKKNKKINQNSGKNIKNSDEEKMGDERKKEMMHSDDKTIGDILSGLNEKQNTILEYIISVALNGTSSFDLEKTLERLSKESGDLDNISTLFNDEQKDVIYYLVSEALKLNKNNKNIEHSDEGGTEFMKHNIFENDQADTKVLTHADFSEIIADAKKSGSLKDAFLAHAGEGYGFGPYTSDRGDDGYDGIDVLFPDAKLVDKKIEMLRNNPTDWVVKVMNGVHKSPFSRIKMIYADITGDDARAKGYVTGNQKVSEVIALLHRTTSPTTIYKLQKLDRDDIIDITDFDIVAWLKAEMRIMLDEEIARQILVGDFRSSASNEKIDDNCVRPILTDTSNDLYAMRYSYAVGATENEYEKFIDECCLAMIGYEGTGSPTLYTTPEYVGHMLLVKDTLGNRIYKTKAELASACGVKEIVEVPYMKDQTRTEDAETIHSMGFTDSSDNDCLCKGIIVNLTDYTVGADKGGAVNMFDDFDIDFNKYTYLIETRISGSLTKPKSAIVIGVRQA